MNKDVLAIYDAVGCDECFNGYKGRIALHEVLLLNQDIRDAIINNVKKEELRNLVYNKDNTLTLLEDGLAKIINGSTTIEEVVKVIDLDTDFGENDVEIRNAFLGKELKKDEENLKKEQSELIDTL